MLSLQLLGGLTLEGPDGPLSGPAAQRKRLALLALLATAPAHRLSRDKLVAYLWPESGVEPARHQLSSALYELRRAAGENAIIAAGDELRLNPAIVRADVVEFEAALEREDPAQAVALYRGLFLDGFFLSDAAEFERWADHERERLATCYGRALEDLAGAAGARGDFTDAARWWKARAAIDPYDTRVALEVMRALEVSGNRAGALQHAAIHQRRLEVEFDAEPDPELLALADRVRREPTVMATPSGAESGPPPPSSHPLAQAAPSDPAPGGPHRTDAGPTPALRLLPGLAALGLVAGAFWLARPDPVTLHPDRVVVAPFENRTGEPDLDPLGSMAADWITQGLSHTGIVEVVPTSTAMASARRARAALVASAGLDPVRTIAEETGAGVVVWGSYYRTGDSVQFQAQISDARHGRLLRALPPIAGADDEMAAAIEQLRQRTMGALAPVLDARLAPHARITSVPPSYEAYRAYAEGSDAFVQGRWLESIEHFERATTLDSAYLTPRLSIAMAYANLGADTQARAITRDLDRLRDRLTPYERALLDVVTSWQRFDQAARYEAARRAGSLALGSLPHVQWGIEAARSNRPREALEVFSTIDPTRGDVRGWPFYWRYLTEAQHTLGRHRRELREARRARRLEPENALYLLLEARALAALGRTGDVERLVDARMSLSEPASPDAGRMMVLVTLELRAHGQATAARAMARRAVAWYDGRPAEEQRGRRHELARALLLAGDEARAQAILEPMSSEESDVIDHQGVLALLAARRGDRVTAERIAGLLAAREPPHAMHTRFGWVRTNATYWRACIAAELGSPEEAVAVLREALSQTVWHGFLPHTDPCLDPLRDYPPFRELMRPKG